MNSQGFTDLYHRILKFAAKLTILTFLTLVFVGMFNCANPIMTGQMNPAGTRHPMADCTPGKDCGMDISTHISIWQGMITSNLPSDSFSLFATLLIAAFIFGIYKTFSTHQTTLLASRYLYYERDHRENRLYNYFISIFSSGILQPKLFA